MLSHHYIPLSGSGKHRRAEKVKSSLSLTNIVDKYRLGYNFRRFAAWPQTAREEEWKNYTS